MTNAPESFDEPLRTIEFGATDAMLREDVKTLGTLVGEILAEQRGPAFLDEVERLRRAAIGRRENDAPVAALLGVMEELADGRFRAHALTWADAVTENPQPGDTEVWEVFNLTGDAHPIHVHETPFEVLGRAFERRGLSKDSAHALVLWSTVWGCGCEDLLPCGPAPVDLQHDGMGLLERGEPGIPEGGAHVFGGNV